MRHTEREKSVHIPRHWWQNIPIVLLTTVLYKREANGNTTFLDRWTGGPSHKIGASGETFILDESRRTMVTRRKKDAKGRYEKKAETVAHIRSGSPVTIAIDGETYDIQHIDD